jgi:pyruvate/2-oxoglutarate/acetoin dehydrogenase E1 component
MLGVGDALRADPRVFVYGEDVGGSTATRSCCCGRC